MPVVSDMLLLHVSKTKKQGQKLQAEFGLLWLSGNIFFSLQQL